MGRRYRGSGSAAVGTNKTVLAIESKTTIRPAIYDLLIGCGATPVGLATIFHLERFTVLGTEGFGFTPVAIDPEDPAALADYGTGLYTFEPTYSDVALLKVSLNQRANYKWSRYHWFAAPGRGFQSPAAANNGIGLQSQSSGGVAVHEATMLHEE